MVQVLVVVASAIFSRVRKSGAGPVFSLRLDMRVNCYSVSVWCIAGRGGSLRGTRSGEVVVEKVKECWILLQWYNSIV